MSVPPGLAARRLSPRGALALSLRWLTAVALVATGLVVTPPTSAQAADPAPITLAKASSGAVLFGGSATFTLTASNPANGAEQYNLSFTDTLPQGLSYTGPTSPANFGEPQVITIVDGDNGTPADPADDPFHQVLVWSNVSDLTPGASQSLTFSAQTDPAEYPIGSTIHNEASAWVSSDPREVPSFDSQGELEPAPAVTGDTDAADTQVTAVDIEKSEGSPEGELLRGVNDHQTIYSLKVTNNFVGPTGELVVTDYLPAGIEFLGCGPGDFNSTTPEYPGAGNKITVSIPGCLAPLSVDTVALVANDPTGNPQALPAGVYTKVVWDAGTLAAKESLTIKYAAGIPQRANTMTWSEPAPTPASGKQAANLNNNNGPSTRETAAEQVFTNHAMVAGKYDGQVVGDTDRETVTAEDLRLLKSVSPTEFVQGQLATYSLDIAVSEYMDASALSITDAMPAGLCPVVGTDPAPYTPDPAVAEECEVHQGVAPTNGTITAVTFDPDGTHTLTITPDATAMAANGHVVIAYQAMMRANFLIAGNSPTSSLDEFTNTARITGVTDPDPDVNAPVPNGTEAVSDTSSSTLASTAPNLTKLRLPNADPMTCSDTVADYKDTVGLPADEPPFTRGDRVCFLLKVDFPQGVDTRSVQLSDFLPSYLTYEASHAIEGSDLVAIKTAGGSSVIWTLGKAGTTPLIVPKRSQIYIVMSAIVVKAPPVTSKPQPLAKENLAKLRWTNSAGKSQSLRDAISLPVGPPPPVAIGKGVQAINGTQVTGGGNQGGNDNLAYNVVRGTDTVTYRIDVQNTSVPGEINAETIAAPEVWDVLPPGFTCASITASAPAHTTCYDAGAPGRPVLNPANTTASLVLWKLPDTFTLAPQQFRTITYDLAVPAEISVSTELANTAAVVSYRSATNIPAGDPSPIAAETALHYPASNLDAGVPSSLWDVPAAADVTSVKVPDAAVAKSLVTSIVDLPTNTVLQGTAGELVTYTVDVTIPARTTVYQGLLADPMPTGITFVGPATAELVGGTLPASVTLENPTANGNLRFGDVYTNATAANQVFRVTIPARVNNSGLAHAQQLQNTATFTSNTAVGGSAITPRTAAATLTVVLPAPTLSKTRNPAGATVPGGQVLTYTLTAGNGASRPKLHDTVVTDCVPAGIVVGTTNPTTGVTVTTNACGTGNLGTRIDWTIGSIAGGGSAALTYTATITGAAGSQSYTNTAGLTGSSLNDGSNGAPGSPNEGVYTATANNTVNVSGAAVTKTANPTTLTIGQRGSFTVTTTLPANLDFFDSVITDTIPAGFTVTGLSTDSVTCTGFGTCPSLTSLASSPAAPGNGVAATVGWSIGDITADAVSRTISVTYSVTLADVASNTATPTTNRTNTGYFRWNLTNKNTVPSVTATFDKNASRTATITVVEPKLTVAKGVSDTTPDPDDTFTYTVTATNALASANASAAYNLTLEDTVPVGVVVNAATISDGGVLTGAGANGGGKITWTVPGPINPGAAVTRNYQAKLAASGTLTAAGLTNSVAATRYESLPSGGRTTYTAGPATATVTPQFPHITPTKAVEPGPAYLGVPKTWTITLASDGRSKAYKVDATDTLPLNWRFVPGSATVIVAGNPATPAAFATSFDASGKQVLTWTNVGDIPVGQTAVITFQATPMNPDAATAPGVGATVSHTNTVATLAQDATGATASGAGAYNGSPATASTQIHSADVQVTKTSDHNAVAGEKLTYTLTVKNNGPDQAVGGFVVTDTLPTGYAASVTSASGWACSPGVGTISCTRTGTLNSGASFPVITVELTIPAGTATGTELVNAVTVASTTHDPNLANNSASVTDRVTHEIDLGIGKRTTSAVEAGSEVTYALDVRNYGPSDSAGPVRVTDPLPSGTSFVSAAGATAGEWDCALVADVITCDRAGALAANAVAGQIVVKLKLAADQTGNLVNRATVAGPVTETDVNPANNSAQVSDPIQTSADLQLAKVHLGTFVAGSPGTYRFTIENRGPSDAAGPLTLTDTLPGGVTYDSVLTGGWNCAATPAGFDCSRPAGLALGQTTVLEVRVNLDSSLATATSILNTATVDSRTPDPHLPNNTDTDDGLIDRQIDLAITKSHTPKAAIEAGSDTEVDFTLAVRNNGPSNDAGVVTVTDTLPEGFIGIAAGGSGWSCGVAARVVTCTHAGELAAGGDAAPISVRAKVAADAGPATLANTASVTTTSGAPDTDPANNTATDEVQVVDRAELSITKVADDDTVVAGGKVTYTVTVHNDGPSDADAVVVADTLPAGLTLVKVTAVTSGLNCNDADPIDCRKATLAAGASFSFTVEATVGAGVADGTRIDNTATVTTATPEGNTENNSATETITVYTEADLSIVKSHEAESVTAGEQVSFDLEVANLGPSDALAPIVVTDELPAGMTFLSSTGDWECVASAATAAGQDVTCTLLGGAGLLAGATAPALSITVLVASDLDPEVLVEGRLANTAAVTSPTTDPDPENNADTDAVNVRFDADLSITKAHTGAVRVGDELSFTMVVANAGSSTARGVRVSDPLPAGLEFVSASGVGWTCAPDSADCTLDVDLAAGATAEPITVTVKVLPTAYPGVTNVAEVESNTPDSRPENNKASDEVVVPPQVDLSITKTHSPEPLQVGSQATYSLTVGNAGNTDDPGPITVSDPLPTGLGFVSGTGDGWTCTAVGQDVTCVLASGLKTGATTSIALMVDVLPAAYPALTNVATVTSPAEDTNPGNNVATDPATVLPLYDLSIVKDLVSLNRPTAIWSITVTNAGPNAAPNGVVVTDDLPRELVFDSYAGQGWACSELDQLVTCTYAAPIEPGTSVSFELTTGVRPGTPAGTVVNSASIVGGETDVAEGELPDENDDLAYTGGAAIGAGLLGLALLGCGALLLVARRRRS